MGRFEKTWFHASKSSPQKSAAGTLTAEEQTEYSEIVRLNDTLSLLELQVEDLAARAPHDARLAKVDLDRPGPHPYEKVSQAPLDTEPWTVWGNDCRRDEVGPYSRLNPNCLLRAALSNRRALRVKRSNSVDPGTAP